MIVCRWVFEGRQITRTESFPRRMNPSTILVPVVLLSQLDEFPDLQPFSTRVKSPAKFKQPKILLVRTDRAVESPQTLAFDVWIRSLVPPTTRVWDTHASPSGPGTRKCTL